MWGSDYPHHEGKFPRSREVLAHLSDDIEIGEEDKADIIVGSAARLFRLKVPQAIETNDATSVPARA